MSGTMHEPETLYTTPLEPSIDDPIAVLAFVLVPVAAFCQAGDDLAQMRAVHEILNDAKRDILLRWYAQATRRCG